MMHFRYVTCSPPFQLLHTSSLARKVTGTDEAVDQRDHDTAVAAAAVVAAPVEEG